MKMLAIVFILLMLPAAAQAIISTKDSINEMSSTHKVGNKCANATYKEDPSIDYVPDETADGWALKPTELNPSPFAKDAFDDVQIGLDVPLNNYIDADQYNYDASRTDIGIGVLGVKRDGTTTLNGKTFSNHHYLDPDCFDVEGVE